MGMFWVDVCNRAADWTDYDAAAQAAGASGTPRLAAAAHAAVVRDAGLLLRAFAARYLGVPLPHEDTADLSRWIASVTLRTRDTVERAVVAGAGGLDLPGLAAFRPDSLVAPFEILLSTALLQFAATDAAAQARVHRCHGVVRAAASRGSLYPAAWEVRFAERAGIGNAVAAGQAQQCGVLLFADRGGRYCSKACANASFAARKIAAEPAYFAAKQGRYRARRVRERTVSRRRPDALVFLD
jgi:hypothetical protein